MVPKRAVSGRVALVCERGKPGVPEKEIAINPINPCGELTCSLFSKMKIEHYGLNSHRLAGLTASGSLHSVVFYSYFISHIYAVTHFEWGRKTKLT